MMKGKCMRCGKELELAVMIPRIKDNIICTECARKEIPDYDKLQAQVEGVREDEAY